MDLDELIEAFRRNPGIALTEAELDLLAAASDRNVWAAKAVMLRHAGRREFEKCLPLLERIAALEPSAENVSNWVVGLRSAGRIDAALRLLRDREEMLDRISFCELMGSLLWRTDRAEAVRYGDEALALKHASAPPVPVSGFRTATFDPERPERNVIAFSIWGSQPRYLNGAVTNAVAIRYLYPGWTARFYTDESTPAGFVDALLANGAQVVRVDGQPAASHGLFWRFRVEDDEEVDLFLVRDCDSVVNIKERWAVADWLRRGRAFHVMRDHPVHCELILAGMWGAHRGNVGDMAGRVAAFLARPLGSLPTADQHFTRSVLWPIVQGDVVVHDSCFSFGDPFRYSPDFPLPRNMHIGQNERARQVPGASAR
jgi:hypothetical protein